MSETRLVRLRPFEDIIGENTHTNNDMSGRNWNIYHNTATKCVTVPDNCRKYFNGLVHVWPNEKINTIIERDDYGTSRKVYKAQPLDGAPTFDVYNHWFTDEIYQLPEELFEI